MKNVHYMRLMLKTSCKVKKKINHSTKNKKQNKTKQKQNKKQNKKKAMKIEIMRSPIKIHNKANVIQVFKKVSLNTSTQVLI